MAPKYKDSSSADFEELGKSLKLLFERIKLLDKVKEVPKGTVDGLIALNFGDYEVDKDEGPQLTVDRAWNRTFQTVSEKDRYQLVTRGTYGAQLIYKYFAHWRQQKEYQRNEPFLSWLNIKTGQLQELVDIRYVFVERVST